MLTTTNLVRCSECHNVHVGGDVEHCPNCDKLNTMVPAYTMSDSRGRVLFKRVTEPAAEVTNKPAGYSTRVSLAGLGVPLHFVGGRNTRFEVHIHCGSDPGAKPEA